MRAILLVGIIAIALFAAPFITHADPYCWIVAWYDMDSPGEFGRYILTEVFPFEFSRDWDGGVVLSAPINELCLGCARYNYVGFRAKVAFFVDTQQKATLTITANNGFKLFLDGECILSSWQELVNGVGVRTRTVEVTLYPGVHELTLHYYEWEGSAQISFSTTAHVLDLREAIGKLRQENALLRGQVTSLQDRVASLEEELASLQQQLEECLRAALEP